MPTATRTTERTIELPRFRAHVREAGTGAPLVLLHGWPQHGGMWDPVIEPLARTHRVLVPDLRGSGRSSAPQGDYSKHALAADVLDLLDAYEIERATIVGHDWGGWIAWLLALEHPSRVERFASLDVPPPWSVDASPARIPRQLFYGSYQLVLSSPLLGRRLVSSPRFIRTFIRAGGTRRRNLSDVHLDRYARFVTEPAHAAASVELYRTFLLRELPAIMRGTYTTDELKVPGLAVMGEKSAITKMTGVPRPRPGLQSAVVANAGHFLLDEAPEEVLALLRPFLAA